ncbi:aspartic proteinase-like protein 2 [Brachypodium distachyon]|uniref:Xylanase inhibitor N-terminal domain-containing protein n=1 Tax=Brachypodium distachyon TaxID=15368 RepID=A0A2K2DD70_BRADI|nr:aspartic proteinase-like protein 2 [Brachypodium distachyon]PNT72224.1 hypothetical protein BRADI_2g41636v3 [Brachypodium distachyon]|eukprot:XP_024315971.1 aspartic proteinase-like protein 2 [Brachypodium distachyon]
MGFFCQPQGAPELSAPPGLFDPKLSSSSALLACSDSRCKDLIRGGYGTCRRDICEFDLRYGPLSVQYSAATGYYLSDSVGLEIFEGSTSVKTSSAPILFGCSTYRSGELSEDAFDGFLGFGPFPLSFSSQLHSLGLSFDVFSICMRSSYGGGILVFGEILEPGIIYTPLVTSL